MEIDFETLFPNCQTIQINSFEHDYSCIFNIIDRLRIIEKIEYNIGNNGSDEIYFSYKYKNFFDSLLSKNLYSIKIITINNKLSEHKDFANLFDVKKIKSQINFINNQKYAKLKDASEMRNAYFSDKNPIFFALELEESPYKINAIKFNLIDASGNVLLNENLINLQYDFIL